MNKLALHHLLILALVVLTSLAHIPVAQAAPHGEPSQAVAMALASSPAGHATHAADSHLHSTADHSHAATTVAAAAGQAIQPRCRHALQLSGLDGLSAIGLGLKRPPRT